MASVARICRAARVVAEYVTKPKRLTPVQELAFDVAAVEPPKTCAFVDRCAVRDNGYLFELVFWYSAAIDISLVRVLVPVDALKFQIADAGHELHESVREGLKRLGISADTLDIEPPATGAPGQIYWANFFSMADYSLQATIDCLFLSPRTINDAVAAGHSPKASDVTAVLGIRLMAPLLLGLLDHIEGLVPSLNARLGL